MSTDENDTAEDSSASPRTQSVDVVVVGAGTSGCYAAATIANAGYDVTIVERKPEEEAGHIACGDALKGADAFPEAIPKSKIEPAFTNTEVDHGRFEIPQEDTVLDIPVPGELAVIDRWEYGRLIIEGAEEAGADLHYDTVVQDVKQDDDGTVTGIVAKHDGEVVEYDADIVIDGAGSLSLLQDKVDFSDATFDTNVSYQHFSSAYREVVEVPEPVEWSDALVFKPAEVAAGYVWYFPRTETEINAGLGFQMTEEPMKLVDDLKRDLRERPEFEGAEVIDKLGAALPTRRPYDSATAPGYMAVGDASEELLWRYNQRVMDHFGGRYASLDVYNILSTAVDVDDLMGLIASIPGEKLAEALYSGTTSFGPVLLAQTAASSYGHWSRIYEFFKIKRLADELLAHYGRYPSRPSALEGWQVERDRIMDDIYELTGADPKY